MKYKGGELIVLVRASRDPTNWTNRDIYFQKALKERTILQIAVSDFHVPDRDLWLVKLGLRPASYLYSKWFKVVYEI